MSTTSVRPPETSLFLALLARLLLRLSGWRVEGFVPNIPKLVIIGAPHTTNWDGIMLVVAGLALRLRLNFLAKQALFKPPLGWIMPALGGVPVDRKANRNAVQQAVDSFNARDRMVLVIAPEGTRFRTDRWKSGFYYIAQGAGVPILPASIDYKLKTVKLGPAVKPSGDTDADMAIFRQFYTGASGKYPERMSKIAL